ncbi:MAG: hypothetical protein Q8L85_07595 [Alphaproteobacteria bacterium]|nr:hypothetical protein [Alphaproteobacteria bacterium]
MVENNNNLIARAFLQILTQQGTKGAQFDHLPKDIRKKTFYDSKTILGNFIEKQYIAPAKNYRSLIQDEKKYQNLINDKKNKKLIKEVRKLEKSITKQGDQIKSTITALHKLSNDGSTRAFSILRKDLLKNKNTYLTHEKIKNINVLQAFFINLATRYVILIDLNQLQETYEDIQNNYDILFAQGIDFIYYSLLFFSVGYGDLEAIEEISNISEDKLALFFQYFGNVKPKYKFLIKTIQKIINFYKDNKEIINNNEELQLQMAILYTNEVSHLDDLSPQNKPPLIHFDLTSMQHLACLGNVNALEWLSETFMLGKKHHKAACYAEIGYRLGNINCGFMLSKIIRQHEKNTEELKNLYTSLFEQCKTRDNIEYLINEISSCYFFDGLVKKKFNLIDNSFAANFNKIINLSLMHNLPNHEKLLQYATLVGLIYFLNTNENSYCVETYNWALLSYELDPTSTNLFIICQILSNPDWLHETLDKKNEHTQKYIKLFLEEDLLLNPIPFENIEKTKGVFALELGSIYLQEKNYKEAAHYFKMAIDFGSNNALIPYASLCIYYLEDLKYDEVKEVLLKVVDLKYNKHDEKKGYFLLGFMELLHSNYTEAHHYFEIGKRLGSKDAAFHHSITQKILEHQSLYEHSINNKFDINPNDEDSSSGDTIPIFSDDEQVDLTEPDDCFVDSNQTPIETSTKTLSLSSEIDYEPWKKYPSTKLKQDANPLNQDEIEDQESAQKKIKIDRLVEELKKPKLKKRKMTKYLSRLLSLVDKEAYITPGEAVRVKFNVGDMVLPMHIQHPSAGNTVEAGRLRTIQTFVDALASSH